MGNYIVNHETKGFDKVDIKDNRLSESGSTVVVILDESTNDKLYDYYNKVLDILTTQNKLVVIITGKESKIRKPICTLMASYRNYNMYYVENKEIITEEYLNNVINRESSYEEIQSYVGGDVSGYSDISAIVIGINAIINSGELEGLKTFINNHITSIESFPEIVDYMKKVVDTANSGELFNKIEGLRDEADKLQSLVDSYKKELKDVKDDNAKLKEELTSANKDLSKTKNEIDELNEQISNKGSIIKTYKELNTAVIQCKVKSIIYFKEVSYVRYTNSLVNALLETLKIKKVNFKLLIYDNKSGISNVYRPAPVIGGAEYLANKDAFLKSTEKLVIVEPTQTIIEDILKYSSPAYDVVIVYDRLKQTNDIVTGNNVHKYFVINSYKDYIESKGLLKITETSHIITNNSGTLQSGIRHEDGEQQKVQLPKERLCIPQIEDYEKASDTSRISKYMRTTTANRDKSILTHILSRFGI